MKISLRVFCLIAACALSQAAPFTYLFGVDYVSSSNPALFGSGLLTTITFDNGGSSNANQVFTYGDIVAGTSVAVGGTFGITAGEPTTLSVMGDPSHVFATTDAEGRISLIPPFSEDVVTTDAVTISGLGDETIVFAAWWFTGTWQGAKVSPDEEAFGPLLAVPEPRNGTLLILGFAMSALRLRRKAGKGSSSWLS